MYMIMQNLHNDYVDLVSWLVKFGNPVTTRGLKTVERTGVTFEFSSVDTEVLLPIDVKRGVNLKLAAVEALSLLSGSNEVALTRYAAPRYADVLVDPDDTDYGSYGLRLRSQLNDVLTLLEDDPDTRRAVLAVWREDDLTHDGDRPCTLSIHFLIRAGRLEMHVNMRSQDVWLGVPYDVFMFSQLQLSLAYQLDLNVGKYVHHVGSLHVYEHNLADAAQLTKTGRFNLQPLPDWYPRGVAVASGDDSVLDVADYVLRGSVNVAERELNRWYVEQIEKIKENEQ